MSDLLDEFLDQPRRRGGVPCWYERMDLSEEHREKLVAAFAVKTISTPKITEVIRGWGFDVSPGAVYNHRVASCSCKKHA